MHLGALSSTTKDVSASAAATRPLPSFHDEEPLPAFPLEDEDFSLEDAFVSSSPPAVRHDFLSSQWFNFRFDAAARKRSSKSSTELALLINDIIDQMPFDLLHPSLELIEDVISNSGFAPEVLAHGHKLSEQQLHRLLNTIHMALTEVMTFAEEEPPTNRVIRIEPYPILTEKRSIRTVPGTPPPTPQQPAREQDPDEPLPGGLTYDLFVDLPENEVVENTGVYLRSATAAAATTHLNSAVTVIGQQTIQPAVIGVVPPLPIRCA